MLRQYYDFSDNVNEIFYTLSLDEILDPSNKITECLDDAWKYAMTLKWADRPGDLRYPGDSTPSITVNNIICCLNTFGKTDDLLRIHVTLKPDEREYRIDVKILIDADEYQCLTSSSAIGQLTHKIYSYDETRDDLRSMVVIKHFLDQFVFHLKPKFGLMYTSKVLRGCSWLKRDQIISILSNKKEEK